MLNYKKIAALLMSMLICASASAIPVLADNEPSSSFAAEGTEQENKVSGIFTYSVTSDNTARIEGCSGTEKDLVIPSSIDGITVTELGKKAFGNVDQLPFETITLPDSLNYISGSNPFSFCSNLKEIKIDGDSQHYTTADGVLYSKDKSDLIYYPPKKKETSFAIPEGVKNIGQSAFYLSSLSEIKFPSTLESIDTFAFGYCTQLASVDFSSTNLQYIHDFSFSYCDLLSDVRLPDSLMEIGGGAFAECRALEKITLPKYLQYIGQHAFTNTGLKKIVIPSSVSEIGYCAFGYSYSQSGEEIMDSSFIIVGETGSAAQSYATDTDTEYEYANSFKFRTPEQDEELSYLEGLTIQACGDYQYAEIENGAAIIYCSSVDSVINVPAELDGVKITDIYPAAFSGTNASEIVISEGIENVRKTAFYDSPNLKKVTLPQSVVLIEDSVFSNCTALETVDLGGAVTIGSDVFTNCASLKNLTISGNCTDIGNEADEPFLNLASLESINVSEGDGAYSSEDGILYSKDKSVLVCYPNGRTDKKFTVPESVKELALDAFCGNSHLKEVDISHVEIIGMSAFENCKNLSSVKLSKNLKKVGGGAFYDCTNLKDIRLYTSDTEIGEFAFGYFYDESLEKEDGTMGGNAVVDGFRIYTNKSKNDTGVDYAKNNNIKAVTNTTEIFGKNIRNEIFWVCGGGIGLLIAALIGSVVIKKSKQKKRSSPVKNTQKEKDPERSAKKSDEEIEKKDNEKNEKED